MDPSRGDSRYNLNYSMSSIGLTLADQAEMYGNPAAVAALGGRPPSAGLLQNMSTGGGSSVSGLLPRSAGNLMPNTQCQSLNNNVSGHSSSQQRGLKRTGSDCYDDTHHRIGGGGINSLQGLDNCGSSSNVQHNSQQQPQSSSGGVQDIVEDNYNNMQGKKSPPANGKKTKGRVKIKMEYIDNKLRRYTTFSKRKTGIMKKAYELSTLTGTQVMLLVASETGHVYTFATRKLQPMITSEAGKQLIQTCLNSPDPPSVGGDQRMSATGFEETELSYNIADEDSKEMRSPLSSTNESDESSDIEGSGIVKNCGGNNNKRPMVSQSTGVASNNSSLVFNIKKDSFPKDLAHNNLKYSSDSISSPMKKTIFSTSDKDYPASDLSSVPQGVLLQLIESGHLQVHTEEDGSGHHYVALPLTRSTVDRLQSSTENGNCSVINSNGYVKNEMKGHRDSNAELILKEEQ